MLIISMQLATICQKLQLKWSPTLYYRMAQGVHFENLKINNKLIKKNLMKFMFSIVHI
jgi:hypothetical protein